MRILLHRNIKKRYKKLNQSEQRHFKERGNLFLECPFHPLLNNHALQGEYQGCRSINITGDLRAIYKEIDSDTVYFIALGTHPELYE
jgi:addiction module RelE/StbE family toxin